MKDIGLGPHDLEPAGLGPAHRQIPRRCTPMGAVPTSPCYQWLKAFLAHPDPTANVVPVEAAVVADESVLAGPNSHWRGAPASLHVSTVITGASRVEQVEENLGVLDAPRSSRPTRWSAWIQAVVADAPPRRRHHRRSGLADGIGIIADERCPAHGTSAGHHPSLRTTSPGHPRWLPPRPQPSWSSSSPPSTSNRPPAPARAAVAGDDGGQPRLRAWVDVRFGVA